MWTGWIETDQDAGPIRIKDMVMPETDPNNWFRNGPTTYGPYKLSNQDSTGFGWIAVRQELPLDAETTITPMVLLIPEIPQ